MGNFSIINLSEKVVRHESYCIISNTKCIRKNLNIVFFFFFQNVKVIHELSMLILQNINKSYLKNLKLRRDVKYQITYYSKFCYFQS